jgi:hypothetical protein
MTTTDYKPEWPDDVHLDVTRCRARAYDRISSVERQCRMKPIADGLCRHHARTKDMKASCPVCLGPSMSGMCDTCETAYDEAERNGTFATKVSMLKWICDRARGSLRARIKKESR